ncbi:MAG: orotidine-5'-phosphate decarboxylase [Betaproteobacteria bacterium]|nr:orotidine-5'-phosphate decarboxylase [Betaproteobacteria bacterium]
MNDPKIIVALDYPAAEPALAMAAKLDPTLCRVKVGKELFTAAGPALVQTLVARGFGVFLDLKFHDIPNTVASACKAAARLGSWMINVHASGGRAMMQAAREALDGGATRPKLIAVTVLTSMAQSDLADIGIPGGAEAAVLRLARLAQAAGLDGVVCSAQEARVLRAACGAGFHLVTPGIRLADAGQDDQKRVMTPRAAIEAGADFLVIGRPITQAAQPIAALERIQREIAA